MRHARQVLALTALSALAFSDRLFEMETVMTLRSLSCVLALHTLAAPSQAQWTLGTKPTLTIGSNAIPAYQFNQVETLRRLSDGRIVVTTGPDIRFFDTSGNYLSKGGGRGSGPGEFQRVSDLVVIPGDTLMTLNVRTIIVLDPEGKFVRQVQPDLEPLLTSDWRGTEGSVLLPNGNILAPQYLRQEMNPDNGPLHRPKLRYSILDLSSAKVTPLHVGGGYAQQIVNRRPMVMPFTPHEQYAIGANRVYVGDNDSTIIRAFDLTGRPLGVISVADKTTPVTAADLETEKERQLEWAKQNRTSLQDFEQRWAATPKPTRHPYWGTALVDASGVLWVSAPPRAGNTPISWTTFDKSGKRIGSITMPVRFSPKDIGTTYVLGVQRDEDGVETLAMYSLRRR
jgi:hypothetical protein